MRGYHDLGGSPGASLNLEDHKYEPWEKRVDAMLVMLIERNVITLDEHRRVHESLGDRAYAELPYYERWIASTANLFVMKGVISIVEIANKMLEIESRVAAGDDRAI